MSILSVMIVRRMMMSVFEKESADDIHRQRDEDNTNRLIKMNRQRNKEAVDGFAGHEQRDDREHNRAGESSEDADFACSKAVSLARRMSAHEIISDRGDQERRHMRAHVPAIGQQRHGMREKT